jgi:anti-sigma regulatory factor (Ser/Thr protein kinase)
LPGVRGKPSVMGPVPDPPRSRSKELRAGPRTATEARLFLSEALGSFDVKVDMDAAHLLTSEIASNAVRHGKEPIDVSVSMEETGLRVSVFDRGSGFDPGDLRFDEDMSPEAWAEDGRGLQLVHALSSDWGVERRDEGTEVWFRL